MSRKSDPRRPVNPVVTNQPQANQPLTAAVARQMASAVAGLWYQHGRTRHSFPYTVPLEAPTALITAVDTDTGFQIQDGKSNDWEVLHLVQKGFDSIKLRAVLATQNAGPGLKVRFVINNDPLGTPADEDGGWIPANRGQLAVGNHMWHSDFMSLYRGDTSTYVAPRAWRRTVVTDLMTPTLPANRIIGIRMDARYTDSVGYEDSVAERHLKLFELTAEDEIAVLSDEV